jgi:hypothetical protein
MKRAYYFLCIFVPLCFFSCRNEKFEGYSVTEAGLYYKLFSIGSIENYPKVGDFLTVNVIFKTERDVVIHHSVKKIALSKSPYNGSLEEGILMLSDGDSASFKLVADSFYLIALHKPLPDYIASGSYLTIGIKIIDIKSGDDDFAINKSLFDDYEYKDMDELLMLAKYLKENNLNVKADDSGLFMIKETETDGRMPQKGYGVRIHYTGSFLDGRIFDATSDSLPFDFILGIKDQVIPGIEYALYQMHEGEKAKVIIPSFLAFGEKGSSTGIVPPYTPVIYKLELLQVN